MFDALAQKTNWSIYSFGNIIRINTGSWININDADTYQILGVRSWGEGVVIKRSVVGAELTMKRYQVSSSEQLMWCKVDTKNGAFGVTKGEHIGALASSNMCLADINTKRCLPALLQLFFRLPAVYKGLTAVSLGTTNRQYLKPQELLTTVRLHLPPLEEQRSLVVRIEELAAKIAEARGLRSQTVAEVEALIYSSRGQIVELLRQDHPDIRLGDVCTKITDGPHVSPSYVSEGVPFISVRNISESGIDFSTAKYVTEEDHKIYSKKANVEHGDVLYTKGGTTGVARRVDVNREFSIWVHVALLKLNREKVCTGFVEHMLNAPSSKTQALEYTHGSSNKDLGLTRMCNIIFPVPPLPEQRRIVSYLDNLQTKVDALKQMQAETAAELNALLPSILDKAFKGEL